MFKNTIEENICDVCGSKDFIFRKDDNRETVAKRLKAYHKQTAPLIPYYKREGRFYTVDGMKKIDEVWQEIKDLLSQVS